MVRESDNEEERHDRFKSERNVNNINAKQRSPERRSRNSDDRRKDRRKKEGSRSRSRRSKDRRSRTRSRSYERRRSHERRSDDKKRRDDKRRRHSEEKRIDKRVDTFKERFERRRHSEDDSTRQEETIVYYDKTPSPERDNRHKKKKNTEKDKKHKEKKKRSESIERHIDNEIGPSLPSGLELIHTESEKENGSENKNEIYGPVMQCEEKEYGPILPTSDLLNTDEVEVPSPSKERIFGPALPERINVDDGDDSYGPALPPEQDKEDSGDEDIGPMPQGINGGKAQMDLDQRAVLIKYQLENKELAGAGDAVKREEWMTELPEAKRVTLGLGARKFRTKEGPDMSDRSSWSDTPAAKEHKQKLSSLGLSEDAEKETDDRTRKLDIAARDKEMEKMAKSGKKRDKSLLEIHQKEIKKKKKKEEKQKGSKKEERRPFNREVDLQTNRFDEAQKKSIIKKAQLLDSRFSSGESKYL